MKSFPLSPRVTFAVSQLLHHRLPVGILEALTTPPSPRRPFSRVGFRSHSRSSTIQTSSLVGCISHTDTPAYTGAMPVESTTLAFHAADEQRTRTHKVSKRDDIVLDGCCSSPERHSKENAQRANVIKEIFKTEHDYLGHLKNLVDVSHLLLV